MQEKVRSMTLYEWVLLVTLSVLWGGSFFFIGVVVEVLPPLTIVTLRVLLAAIALWGIVYCSGLKIPTNLHLWLAFLGMGILNNVIPFVLIVWGQAHIASGLASILNATTPLFTVVAAHFFTQDERMTPNKILGVVLGVIGVAIMIGQRGITEAGSSLLGQLAVLGGAVSYSFAGIYGRRFKQFEIQPIVTATGQVTASSLLLLPVALFFDKPFNLPMPGLEIWGAVVSLALFSTALAYILYFRILSTAGATNVVLVTLIIPVSAILLGTLILGERLELKHMVGMGMISIGLLAIDGRILRLISSCVSQENNKLRNRI